MSTLTVNDLTPLPRVVYVCDICGMESPVLHRYDGVDHCATCSNQLHLLPSCRACSAVLEDGFQTYDDAPGLYCLGCEPAPTHVPAQVRPQVQALVAHCVGCNGNGEIYDRPCPFCHGRGLALRSTPDATTAVLAMYAALDAVGKAVDLTPWISDLRPNGSIDVRFSYDMVAQIQTAFALAMAAPDSTLNTSSPGLSAPNTTGTSEGGDVDPTPGGGVNDAEAR